MTQNESNILSLQVDAKKAAEVADMLLSKDLKTMDVKQFLAFTVPKIENWSKQLERLKEYSQKRDLCNASEFSAYMGVSRTTTNTWKNLGYITYQGNKIDVQGTIRLWENLHWLF